MNDDFTHFYDSTFRKVNGAVSAFCGDLDVVYESTQEAYARAYARWSNIRGITSPEGWVTKTAMNTARRHFRRTTVIQERPRATEGELTPDRVDVEAALRKLPRRQQEAIVLHYIMGLSVAATAQVMSLSSGGVKAHLHRGRLALRDSLETRHA